MVMAADVEKVVEQLPTGRKFLSHLKWYVHGRKVLREVAEDDGRTMDDETAQMRRRVAWESINECRAICGAAIAVVRERVTLDECRSRLDLRDVARPPETEPLIRWVMHQQDPEGLPLDAVIADLCVQVGAGDPAEWPIREL